MSNFFSGANAIEPWVEASVLACLQDTTSSSTTSSPVLPLQPCVLAQVMETSLVVDNDNNNNEPSQQQQQQHRVRLVISDGTRSICAVLSPSVQQSFYRNNPVLESGAKLFLMKGSSVRILQWSVSTFGACCPGTTQQHDCFCLDIQGSITVLGGLDLGLPTVGRPTPVEKAVPIQQLLIQQKRDWKRVRAVLQRSQQQQQEPGKKTSPTAAPRIPMGNLEEGISNPKLLHSALQRIKEVKQKQQQQQQPPPRDPHSAPKASTPRASAKQAPPAAATPATVAYSVRSDDGENEEDMGIDAMLIGPATQATHAATEAVDDVSAQASSVEQQSGETVGNNSLETQMRQQQQQQSSSSSNPLSSLEQSGETGDPSLDTQMQQPQSKSAAGADSSLSQPTSSQSQQSLTLDTQPIALEDANDKDIAVAYKEAEHTSPGVLQERKVTTAAIDNDETADVIAPKLLIPTHSPLLLQPSPVSTPPRESLAGAETLVNLAATTTTTTPATTGQSEPLPLDRNVTTRKRPRPRPCSRIPGFLEMDDENSHSTIVWANSNDYDDWYGKRSSPPPVQTSLLEQMIEEAQREAMERKARMETMLKSKPLTGSDERDGPAALAGQEIQNMLNAFCIPSETATTAADF